MGYRLDLDEYSTHALRQELLRRRALRLAGKCDYCERLPDTPPCKFPERHVRQSPQWEPLLMRFMRFLRDVNAKPGVLGPHELMKLVTDFRARRST
jgi:hypothetical protein